jgi:2-oxoglutarate dehydrogenase E2 component (dihydrolipoamide succinyltransferase)
MPQLGETVTEGTILRWLKKVGEAVAQDEPLFEVSTDKVDSEVPSPASGVLAEILVPEGATVDVGTRLAVVAEAAGSTPGAAPAAAPAPPVGAAGGSDRPTGRGRGRTGRGHRGARGRSGSPSPGGAGGRRRAGSD